MGGDNTTGRVGPSKRRPGEKRVERGSAASPSSQVEVADDFPQLEISWPQVQADNATLQIPSFVERCPSESHGGSAFRRGGTRELIKENKDPVGDVRKSRGCSFPLDGKAY